VFKVQGSSVQRQIGTGSLAGEKAMSEEKTTMSARLILPCSVFV